RGHEDRPGHVFHGRLHALTGRGPVTNDLVAQVTSHRPAPSVEAARQGSPVVARRGLVHLAGGTAPVNHTHLVRRHPVPPAGDVLPPLPLVVVPGGGRVLGLPARGHVELGQDRVGDCSHGVGWAAL